VQQGQERCGLPAPPLDQLLICRFLIVGDHAHNYRGLLMALSMILVVVSAGHVQPAGYPLGGASRISAVAVAPRGWRLARVPPVFAHYNSVMRAVAMLVGD